MLIGEVIRVNRKRISMTQEEMAKRLGVTAPAVNKWENGNSQPDIMLLAPIARLLGISLDTLLSFQEVLTTDEITGIVYEVEAKLKSQSYEEAFQWVKGIIEQYPNSEVLIWQLTVLLDAWRPMNNIHDSEKYNEYINCCYIRALKSKDEDIRSRAADSLFVFYSRQEQYEKAAECLNYLSKENPERKRKQAYLYSKTNKIALAYREYEEILFSSYQLIEMVLHNMYILAMQNHEKNKASLFADKRQKVASVFEMGKYYEFSFKLEWATSEQDELETIEIMEQMLDSVGDINDFTKSQLYEHMEFKALSDNFRKHLHENLLKCFQDEEIYGYMKDIPRWRKLVNYND